MRRLATLVTAAALAAGLGACGGDDEDPPTILNTEAVERSIEQSVKEQRDLEADVSCPVNIVQKKGNDFTCVATVDDKEYEFEVTQTDDEGHVTYVGV